MDFETAVLIIDVKAAKPKQNFNFDELLVIPAKWLVRGMTLQGYTTVYNITEKELLLHNKNLVIKKISL